VSRRLLGAAGAALVLLAVYVGLSFLNSPRGYLGTDTGGKVATLRVMDERGRFDPDLGYWAERWDPDGALHPIGYTAHTASGKWVNVTTLPALWVGWQLYRVGGYRAALLVPMAGAIAACFAGLALLRRLGVGERHAWAGFWLLGLASPLTIYALDFWEHTLGVALMAWAVVLVADLVAGRSPRARARWASAVGAGLLFGASATLRTETLVYLAVTGAAGVLVPPLSAWLVRRERPDGEQIARSVGHVIALGVGAVVPFVANGILERHVIGVGIRSARVAGTALGIGDAASSRIHEAAVTVLATEGTSQGIVLGAALTALLVFASRRRDVGAALVGLLGAAALATLRFVSGGLGFVPGLVPAWILPAAAASWRPPSLGPPDVPARTRAGVPLRTGSVAGDGSVSAVEPRRATSLAATTVAVIALGAIPLVLATQFRGGAGPQWAGRYLLVSGFLLAVLGWAALERRPPVLRAAFAALALGTTVFGLTWLSVRSHDVDRTIATLEKRPEPVLVSGVYHLAREGGATYGDHRWLTLSPNPGGRPADAAHILDDAGAAAFASVDYAGTEPRRFPGFRPTSTTRITLFDGVDLQITSWRTTP
jgi:hypothetical protein